MLSSTLAAYGMRLAYLACGVYWPQSLHNQYTIYTSYEITPQCEPWMSSDYWWGLQSGKLFSCIFTLSWNGYQALVCVSGTETIRRRMVIPVTWGWLHCFVRDRESCLLTWGGPSWHLGSTCTSPLCTAEKVLTHQTPGWRGKAETFPFNQKKIMWTSGWKGPKLYI